LICLVQDQPLRKTPTPPAVKGAGSKIRLQIQKEYKQPLAALTCPVVKE
jgi:hypothetical protein